VGVRVESENMFTGDVRHTASAYLTFVAMDTNGKPTPAPPLIAQTPDELRRVQEAQERRRLRQGECR